ncbi:MAG: hemerythrin domain-containing protein [Bacteroidaceae bacterium]|nr:hemerythrin domain-containing protein [Bacteroidaceae bacterium]
MNANKIPFTPGMQLAELIDINYKLLPILSQLKFNLGLGNASVADACSLKGVSIETFLLICNVYTYPSYKVSKKQIQEVYLPDVILFLQSSHTYYSSQLIPMLREKIGQLVENCSVKQKTVLTNFFENYSKEVDKHFKYEESSVFPYIHKLLEHQKKGKYSIERFEHNHGNIEDKLNDLKSIIMKYLPHNANESIQYSTLYSIYELHENLEKHTFIENNILVPAVANLEHE